MTQFSLFGAAVTEPALADLDGVLLAGGHWVRSAGTARLSVVVADRWRADALVEEFSVRGVGCAPGETAVTVAEGGLGVRTAFRDELLACARRWTRGANEAPPTPFVLTAGGLRLWTIVAGHAEEIGYLLATDAPDDAIHLAGGAQLSRLGLAGVSISHRGGPGWRVTSAKRIRRLVELVGPAPDGGEGDWPSVR